MDGFSEVFHRISYDKIGTSTIQSRATGGVAQRHLRLRAAGLARRLQRRLGRHPQAAARLPPHALQFRRDHAAAGRAPQARRLTRQRAICPRGARPGFRPATAGWPARGRAPRRLRRAAASAAPAACRSKAPAPAPGCRQASGERTAYARCGRARTGPRRPVRQGGRRSRRSSLRRAARPVRAAAASPLWRAKRGRDPAVGEDLAAGILGNSPRLVGRALVADDHLAHDSFDGSRNEPGQRAGQRLRIIVGLDHHRKHARRITQSAAGRQLRRRLPGLAGHGRQRVSRRPPARRRSSGGSPARRDCARIRAR